MAQLTVQDLVNEINRDYTLTFDKKQELIQSIIASASLNSPLQELVAGLAGSVIANLIAKYFNMGIMGRSISTVAGYGIGQAIYNNR